LRRRQPSLWDLSIDAFTLGLEAQQVIALRLAKFATGGDPHGHEARRMVTEKAAAVVDAQIGLMQAMATGQLEHAPSRALAVYRRKVRANRRRLSKA
jgi:hypothetical protein